MYLSMKRKSTQYATDALTCEKQFISLLVVHILQQCNNASLEVEVKSDCTVTTNCGVKSKIFPCKMSLSM